MKLEPDLTSIVCVYVYVCIHSEQKFKRNTFVFAPFFHGLNSKI